MYDGDYTIFIYKKHCIDHKIRYGVSDCTLYDTFVEAVEHYGLVYHERHIFSPLSFELVDTRDMDGVNLAIKRIKDVIGSNIYYISSTNPFEGPFIDLKNGQIRANRSTYPDVKTFLLRNGVELYGNIMKWNGVYIETTEYESNAKWLDINGDRILKKYKEERERVLYLNNIYRNMILRLR